MSGTEIFFLIVGILALIGLFVNASRDNTPKETLRHPKLRDGVVVFTHNCGNISWMEKNREHSINLQPNAAVTHKGLQRKVKEYITHTPINTELRITNYAWDLTDALELVRFLDDYWDPVAAFYYANGVVMVRYMERPREGVRVSDEKRDLYFAASDGHIIYYKS